MLTGNISGLAALIRSEMPDGVTSGFLEKELGRLLRLIEVIDWGDPSITPSHIDEWWDAYTVSVTRRADFPGGHGEANIDAWIEKHHGRETYEGEKALFTRLFSSPELRILGDRWVASCFSVSATDIEGRLYQGTIKPFTVASCHVAVLLDHDQFTSRTRGVLRTALEQFDGFTRETERQYLHVR